MSGKNGKKGGRSMGSWVVLVIVFTGFSILFGLSFLRTLDRHDPQQQYEQHVHAWQGARHGEGSESIVVTDPSTSHPRSTHHPGETTEAREPKPHPHSTSTGIDHILEQVEAEAASSSEGSTEDQDTPSPTPSPTKLRGVKTRQAAKQPPTQPSATPTPTDADGNAVDDELVQLRDALKTAQEKVYLEKQKMSVKENIERIRRELEEAREWEREVERERHRERERQRERWDSDEDEHKRWRRTQERRRTESLTDEDTYQTTRRQVDNTQRLSEPTQYIGGETGGSCTGMAVPPIKHYAEFKQSIEVTRYAYATFVTTADFVIPACVLMHSIAISGSRYARVIAVTHSISDNDIKLLSVFGQVVRILTVPSPLYIDNPRYRETFTKLRIWQLTDWDKLLYVDTDVMIVRNLDDVFDLNEWGVPMDAMQGRYSTGMMLIEPKLSTFQDMLDALKVTQVSMELPDLLFLKEFFDARKTKVNILPRWYQVYQEEFGAQHKTYLTDQQAPINIFDPRIHGIHYPGAGKPFNNIPQLSQRWGHLLCDWMGREELNYEPQFLWFWGYELMRRDLALNKQKPFFTHEMGELVIDIGEAPTRVPTPAPTPLPPYSAWSSWTANTPPDSSSTGSTPAPFTGETSPAVSPVFTGMECRVDTLDGIINIKRLEPVTLPLKHVYIGYDGEVVTSDIMHEWAFTWCTPFKMTPRGHADCNSNGYASEFAEGYCRSSFSQGLELEELGDAQGMVLKAVTKSAARTKFLEARLECNLDADYHDVWVNSSVVTVKDLQNTTHSDRLYQVTLMSACFCPGVCLGNDTYTSDLTINEGLTLASGRCGMSHPLESGAPAECNPHVSADREGPCCSSKGYCGATSEHCSCPDCVDYRKVYKEAVWRRNEEARLRAELFAIGEYVEPTPVPTNASETWDGSGSGSGSGMSMSGSGSAGSGSEEDNGVAEMDGSTEGSEMHKADMSAADESGSGSGSWSGSGSDASEKSSAGSAKSSGSEGSDDSETGSDEGSKHTGGSDNSMGSDSMEINEKVHKPSYVKSTNGTCPPGKAMLLESFEECAAAVATLKVLHDAMHTKPCNIRNPRGCYLHEVTGRAYWNPCGNPFSTAPGRVAVCGDGLDGLGVCIAQRKWLKNWELAGVNATERRETVRIELDRYYFRAGLPVVDLGGVGDEELAELCNPHAYTNKTDVGIDEDIEAEHDVGAMLLPPDTPSPSILPPPDHGRRRAYVRRQRERKIREREDDVEQRELMEGAGDELGKDYEEMLAYRKSQAGGQEGQDARELIEGVEKGDNTVVTVKDLEDEYNRVVEEGDYELAKRFQNAIKNRKIALLDALVIQKHKAVDEEDFDAALRLRDEILLLNATLHIDSTPKTTLNFTKGSTVRLIVPVLFKNGSQLHPGDTGVVEVVPGSKKIANSPATVRIKGILFDLRPKQAVVIYNPPPEPTTTDDDEEEEERLPKKMDKSKKKKKPTPTAEPDFLGDADPPTPPPSPLTFLKGKNSTNSTTQQQQPSSPRLTQKRNTTKTATPTPQEDCPGGSLDGCIDLCPQKDVKKCVKMCLVGCAEVVQQNKNVTEERNTTCEAAKELVKKSVTVSNVTVEFFAENKTSVDEATKDHVRLGVMLVKKKLGKAAARLRVVDVGAGLGVFSMVLQKFTKIPVQSYEPRKTFHQALTCSGIPAHRTALSLRKSTCLIKFPPPSGNLTDLLPPYALSCTSGNRTVPVARGDVEFKHRVHLLRVATLGMEAQVLEGFKGVFEGPGVDYVITTVVPASLKGLQAFFAELPGVTTLSWSTAPLASLSTVPSAPIASILYQRARG